MVIFHFGYIGGGRGHGSVSASSLYHMYKYPYAARTYCLVKRGIRGVCEQNTAKIGGEKREVRSIGKSINQ